MRILAPVLGCLLIAAKATLACSVVEVVETHPSSPNVRLTVLKDGIPHGNATLVVRLQASAQQVGPPLKTDNRGNAELRNLTPGTYCVTAAADPRLGAVLCLVVSKGNDRKRSEFTLKLVPLPLPPPTLAEQLAEAAKSPPQARARKFEGIVTDVTGASIPRARIVVYVSRSGKEPTVVSLEADDAGRFYVSLSQGNYTAAFQSPGFKTRLMSFAIGPDESQELAPIVLQVGTCT
jgi:hypothetical protein